MYDDALKVALLGVRPATLAAHGAVSEATAREMASGALAWLGGTVSVAVTGIAGPSGGSADEAGRDSVARVGRARTDG